MEGPLSPDPSFDGSCGGHADDGRCVECGMSAVGCLVCPEGHRWCLSAECSRHVNGVCGWWTDELVPCPLRLAHDTEGGNGCWCGNCPERFKHLPHLCLNPMMNSLGYPATALSQQESEHHLLLTCNPFQLSDGHVLSTLFGQIKVTIVNSMLLGFELIDNDRRDLTAVGVVMIESVSTSGSIQLARYAIHRFARPQFVHRRTVQMTLTVSLLPKLCLLRDTPGLKSITYKRSTVLGVGQANIWGTAVRVGPTCKVNYIVPRPPHVATNCLRTLRTLGPDSPKSYIFGTGMHAVVVKERDGQVYYYCANKCRHHTLDSVKQHCWPDPLHEAPLVNCNGQTIEQYLGRNRTPVMLDFVVLNVRDRTKTGIVAAFSRFQLAIKASKRRINVIYSYSGTSPRGGKFVHLCALCRQSTRPIEAPVEIHTVSAYSAKLIHKAWLATIPLMNAFIDKAMAEAHAEGKCDHECFVAGEEAKRLFKQANNTPLFIDERP